MDPANTNPPDGNAPTATPALEGAPAAVPQPPAAAPRERTFTQADVDRVVAERLARDRQTRGQRNEQPAPPPAAAPAATPDDFRAELALRDSFDEVASALPLTPSQRALVRDDVLTRRPSDVAAHVATFAQRAGWTLNAATPPAQSGSAAPATPGPVIPNTPAPPPVTGRPAAPVAPVVTDATPFLSMSIPDREAYLAANGVDKFVEKFNRELPSVRVRIA